jgi:hypothetical protein
MADEQTAGQTPTGGPDTQGQMATGEQSQAHGAQSAGHGSTDTDPRDSLIADLQRQLEEGKRRESELASEAGKRRKEAKAAEQKRLAEAGEWEALAKSREQELAESLKASQSYLAELQRERASGVIGDALLTAGIPAGQVKHLTKLTLATAELEFDEATHGLTSDVASLIAPILADFKPAEEEQKPKPKANGVGNTPWFGAAVPHNGIVTPQDINTVGHSAIGDWRRNNKP